MSLEEQIKTAIKNMDGNFYCDCGFSNPEGAFKAGVSWHEERTRCLVEALTDIFEYQCSEHTSDPCDKGIAKKALTKFRGEK